MLTKINQTLNYTTATAYLDEGHVGFHLALSRPFQKSILERVSQDDVRITWFQTWIISGKRGHYIRHNSDWRYSKFFALNDFTPYT